MLDLGKGHAEHLIPVIDAALETAGTTYADLDAIAVSVGPGSFTGVRVGVAAARGLALALAIPAVGVSTLDALADEARGAHPGRRVLAAISAGRGQVYALLTDEDGAAVMGPEAIAEDALGEWMEKAHVLTGSGVDHGASEGHAGFIVAGRASTADIAVYATIAARRIAAGDPVPRPAPLYLRAADAKPQAGFALPLKDAAR